MVPLTPIGKYALWRIDLSYLVTIAAWFVCLARPTLSLPMVSERDWEQRLAEEKHHQQSCSSRGHKVLCKSCFLFHSTHAKYSFPEVRQPLLLKTDKVPGGVHICNTTFVRLNQILYQLVIYILVV